MSDQGSARDRPPRGGGPRGRGPRGDGARGDRPRGDGARGDRPRDDRRRGNRPGDDRARGDRPRGGGPRAEGSRGRLGGREDREDRLVPPGLEPAGDEPPTPNEIDLGLLPRVVRAQLKSLPPELAATVGAHLVMAGELIDSDPELALAHTLAARRRAARLAVVREATAEAAYAAGDWAIALREFRAVRRMRGDDEVLPVIADCERALGRPREALAIAAEARTADLSAEQRAEMTLVEAGARSDLGQAPEAIRLLRGLLNDRSVPNTSRSRVMFAYAEALWAGGDHDQARTWFARSAELDPDALASDRLAELEGRPLPSVERDEWGVLEVDLAPDEDDDGQGSHGSAGVTGDDPSRLIGDDSSTMAPKVPDE